MEWKEERLGRGKGQTAVQAQPIGLGSGPRMVLQSPPKSGWESEVFILSPGSVSVCGPLAGKGMSLGKAANPSLKGYLCRASQYLPQLGMTFTFT